MKSLPSLKNKIVGIDTETTGLSWASNDSAFGISIAIDGWSKYVDIRQDFKFVEWLKQELPRAKVIIGHHLKFDIHFLYKLGIDVSDVPWHCTMITDTLCYEHHNSYGLNDVAKRRLGLSKANDMIENWMELGKFKSKKLAMASIQHAPYELVAPYAIKDAELLIPLYYDQMNDIKQQNLHKVYQLEMELLPVLADMERHGVRCDVAAAEKSIPELTNIISTEQKKLNDISGFDVNVNSTPQIRKMFKPEKVGKYQYKLIDGTICWATKTGNPSIDQNVLKEMIHPAASMIRRIRKITKLRDTFVCGHILDNVDANGYVHTTFNSTRNDSDAGTVTGRLSSTSPAMQQINGRDGDTSKILRSMFIPDDGDDWLGADYSSADFRIAAHYLNDPIMIQAYAENPNTDFHGYVSEMTGIPRSPLYAGGPSSKTLNLSMAFGAGAGKIASQMGMPFDIEERQGKMFLVAGPEAQHIIDMYHKKFPVFRTFAKSATTIANQRGYVMSLMGRRLRFVNNDGHKAAGYLFQSGCAELMKTALVRLWKCLRNTEYKLFLTVHDEVAISAPFNGTMDKEIQLLFTDYMSEDAPFKLRVPMTSTFKRGSNWYETK